MSALTDRLRDPQRQTAISLCIEAADTISELQAERDKLKADYETLDEHAGYERSSAVEAVNVLFAALGWSSGGLGAAAIEIVEQRDALRAALTELVAALEAEAQASSAYHDNVEPAAYKAALAAMITATFVATAAIDAARAAVAVGADREGTK